MKTLDLLLPDEAATRDLAAILARALATQPLAKQAFVVHLSGDLGSGKTATVRAILRELGFSGPVKSPTFSLMEPYNHPNFPIYHFDLYRFSSSDQWFDAGFDDIFAGLGLMLLEWPEKAAGALAPPDLLLELEATGHGEQRRLRASANTEAGRQCLMCLAPRLPPQAQPPACAAPGTDADS
jgi:tRNA threonylcarbamoyladenosine biosynthesis protein TsaE